MTERLSFSPGAFLVPRAFIRSQKRSLVIEILPVQLDKILMLLRLNSIMTEIMFTERYTHPWFA